MDLDAILKLVAPAIVPIVPAAVAFLKERAESKQLPEAIKRATARVLFWRSYYEARVLVEDSSCESIRADVVAQLQAAANSVQAAQASDSYRKTRFVRPVALVKRALLAYRPPRAWIWALRLVYYYYVGYSLLATVVLPMRWIDRGAIEAPELIVYLVVVLAVAALWMAIQYTEDVIDRRDGAKELAKEAP